MNAEHSSSASALLSTARQLLPRFTLQDHLPSTNFNSKWFQTLINDGRLRAATAYVGSHSHAATPDVLYTSTLVTSQAAAPLHPPRTYRDNLNRDVALASTPVVLSSVAVEEQLKRISKESAPGISGWTYKSIHALTRSTGPTANTTQYTDLIDAITRFFNALLADELAPGCMDVFNDSRLVLLQPRPDKSARLPSLIPGYASHCVVPFVWWLPQ